MRCKVDRYMPSTTSEPKKKTIKDVNLIIADRRFTLQTMTARQQTYTGEIVSLSTAPRNTLEYDLFLRVDVLVSGDPMIGTYQREGWYVTFDPKFLVQPAQALEQVEEVK